ncbi:LolA family protein [Aquisphaera giovannonii]|nr:hypothetical protein [Aquisphaera giovannonii]
MIAAGLFLCPAPSRTGALAQAPQAPAPGAGSGAASPGGMAGATSPATPPKPGEAPAEPPTEAERLIDAAIKKLAAIKSVSANLVQTVEMLKQKFAVRGEYRKAPSSRIYLRLTVEGLADSTGTQLQVCDGDTLWDYQQILESQMYRKRSIKPILDRLNSPDMDARTRDQVMSTLGISGPETLLLGLRKAVKFDQKEEGTLDGKPVYILRGTWRNRSGLVGPDQRPLPATGALPAFIPSLATLYVGKEDGWPYRINLVGKVPTILQDTRRIGPDGRPIGARSSIEKVEPSRMELVYSDVQINPTIPAGKFAFQAPPNANVEDDTESILKFLDAAIQSQALMKRAQATQQDGPVLDRNIDIPKPSSEPTPR